MSLETNIRDVVQRAANISKEHRMMINGNAADLSALTTSAKSNLVAAINELAASIGSAGATINDASTSTTSVWSSDKVFDEIAAAISTVLGGAGAAYDTLAELKGLLDTSDSADDSAIAALTTALGNRVRFDAAQTLTAPQKVQANANMGSLSLVDAGNPNTDFVAVFNAALV